MAHQVATNRRAAVLSTAQSTNLFCYELNKSGVASVFGLPSIKAMKQIFGFMLMLASTVYSVAASEPVFETNAQFEASQNARGEGLAAFRAGDHKAALAKMEQALLLRPGNTLILGYIAYLAAETGNLARAAEAATLFASAGQSPGRGIQGKLAEKLSAEVWAGIKEMFDANVAPKGRAAVHTSVAADVKLIEGIAVAPDGRTFVSSVVSGGIYSVSGESYSLLVSAKAHAMGSFFGITYNASHNSIFATYARVEQTPGHIAGEGTTGVAEFDAGTGALINNWVLEGSTNDHQIADILITHDHKIYVSDATGKAVYAIDSDKLMKLFDLPQSMSPQGIAELGGVLYMADWGRGIWRLDRNTNTATLLGRDRKTNLIGIDGLAARDGKLIAIQNGSNPHKVVAITLSTDGLSVAKLEVLAQSLSGFDEPTLGVSTPSGYYFVSGSQWPKFGKGGAVNEGAALNPTTVLKLQ